MTCQDNVHKNKLINMIKLWLIQMVLLIDSDDKWDISQICDA